MRGFKQGDKAALLISECQRGVLDPAMSAFQGLVDQAQERGIVANIANLADAFRKQGLPVVHAHVAHKANYEGVKVTNVILARTVKTGAMREGNADVEPVPELAPQAGDIVHSRSVSLVGFNNTDLDQVLRAQGVTTLVMVGVSTNIALPGMAVCASDLGYQVIIAEDCTAGASAETHDFAIKNTLPLFSSLTTSGDIIAALRDLPRD